MSYKIVDQDPNDLEAEPVTRRRILLLQHNLINLARSDAGNYIVAKKLLEAAKYNLLQAQTYMAKAKQDYDYWSERIKKFNKKKEKKQKILLLQPDLFNLEHSAVGNYIVAKKSLEAAKYNLLQAQTYMAKAKQEYEYWSNRME
jgi:hypothetical protein